MLAANPLVASKAIWYLMRASGVVSLVLLTAVLVLGIASVNRWRPGRRPRFVTQGLHRSIALLSVVFVAVHVLTALTDPYAVVGVAAVLVPFAAAKASLGVGLGAVSLDLVLALVVSSLVRARIGLRAWRTVHWLAYLAWPAALAHSVGMGSDASTTWLRVLGVSSVAAVAVALAARLARTGTGKRLEPAPAPRLGAAA